MTIISIYTKISKLQNSKHGKLITSQEIKRNQGLD